MRQKKAKYFRSYERFSIAFTGLHQCENGNLFCLRLFSTLKQSKTRYRFHNDGFHPSITETKSPVSPAFRSFCRLLTIGEKHCAFSHCGWGWGGWGGCVWGGGTGPQTESYLWKLNEPKVTCSSCWKDSGVSGNDLLRNTITPRTITQDQLRQLLTPRTLQLGVFLLVHRKATPRYICLVFSSIVVTFLYNWVKKGENCLQSKVFWYKNATHRYTFIQMGT